MEGSFKTLGIPFSLFEAPLGATSDYLGIGQCSMCSSDASHSFSPDTLVVNCPTCGIPNGLDVSSRVDTTCHSCDQKILFPANTKEEIRCCYQCLQQGAATFTKDTELGMISWATSSSGITGGEPDLHHPDFEMVKLEVEDGEQWVGAKLPPAVINELLRTPNYITWQGERWLFCCKLPMIFVGIWDRDEFSKRAPDGDGEAYFDAVVEPGLWAEYDEHDSIGVYVFRCSTCKQHKAHWDEA